MANDIINTNTFGTSNMKPDADEEIVALWGQNMADNLGYLFYRPQILSNFAVTFPVRLNEDDAQGTMFFRKDWNFDRLVGTIQGTSSETTVLATTTLFVNGIKIVDEKHNPSTWGTSINYDVSGLTDGQDYKISYMFHYDSGAGSLLPTLGLTTTLLGTKA